MTNNKSHLSIFRKQEARSLCLSIDRMIQYADKTLSAEENKFVEVHLHQCPFCRESLDGLASFSNKEKAKYLVQNINKNIQSKISFRSSVSTNWKTYYAVAAVLLISMAAVYFLLTVQFGQNKLFAEYFKPYPNTVPIVRSQQSVSEIQLAMQQYELENYKAARNMLEDILKQNPENLTARFYAGVCQLKLNNPHRASEHFENVEKNPDSEFFLPAQWYLALSYLKNKNKQNAKQILIQLVKQGYEFNTDSRELLKKIN